MFRHVDIAMSIIGDNNVDQTNTCEISRLIEKCPVVISKKSTDMVRTRMGHDKIQSMVIAEVSRSHWIWTRIIAGSNDDNDITRAIIGSEDIQTSVIIEVSNGDRHQLWG